MSDQVFDNTSCSDKKVGEDEMVGIIIPAYNEQSAIGSMLSELDGVLTGLDSNFSIVVIDDGSSDGMAEVVAQTKLKTPLSLVRLSRNFGKEIALSAGLDIARARQFHAVIIMDADGQHPPETIAEFISVWRQGFDNVYGLRLRRNTDSALRRYLSTMFYRLLPRDARFIESNAGDFRLLSARALDALSALPEKLRFMKGLYNWVGFKRKAVAYEHRYRFGGASAFSFRTLYNFALVGIMSFSNLPLKLISRIGMMISLAALLYAIVIMIGTLVYGNDVPGWTTLAVGLALLSGVQLIAIGILGEYIGQIFVEVKNRPLYFIESVQDITSSQKDEEQT